MLRNLFSSLEGIIPESIRREPSSSRHDPLPTELKNIVDYGRDYGRGIYPVSRSQSVRPSSKPRGRDGERKSSKRSRSLEKGSRSASGSRQSSRRSSPVTFRETETAAEASRRRKAEHEKQKRRESEKHKQVMAMGVAIHIVHTMLGEQIPVAETSCELIHTISCMVVPILRTFSQASPELVFYSSHLLSRSFPSPIPSFFLPCDANGRVEKHLSPEQFNQVAVMLVRTWMVCLRLSFSWMHDRFYPLADWAYWTHLPPTVISKAYVQLLHILNHNLCLGRADWIVWVRDLQEHFTNFCVDLEWTRQHRLAQSTNGTPAPTPKSTSHAICALDEAHAVEKLQDLQEMLSNLEESTMSVFLTEASVGLNSANDFTEFDDTPLGMSKQMRDWNLKREMRQRFLEYMRSDLPKSLDPVGIALSGDETSSMKRVDVNLKSDRWPEKWPWATLDRIIEEKEKAARKKTGVEVTQDAKNQNHDDPEGRIFDLEIVCSSAISVCKPRDVDVPALTPDSELPTSSELSSDDETDIPPTPGSITIADDQQKETKADLEVKWDSFEKKLREFVLVDFEDKMEGRRTRQRSLSWDSGMVAFAPRQLQLPPKQGRRVKLVKPLNVPSTKLNNKRSFRFRG